MAGIEKSSRDVYYVLFRHKWKAVFFLCSVMFIVTVVTFLTPRSYRSDAKIMVRVGRESVALDPTATTGPLLSIGQSRENEVKSELEILKSRELVERVVDALGASSYLKASQETEGSFAGNEIKRTVGRLLEGTMGSSIHLNPTTSAADRDKVILDFMMELQIEALKNSNIIFISFEAKNRRLAQESLEKLIRFYLEKHLSVHRTVGSYEFFTQLTEQLRDNLTQAQENLRELKNKTGIASPEEQRRLLLKRIGDLQQDVEGTESALASSRKKVETMKKTLSELPETMVTQRTTGNTNPGADLMRSKFYELKLKEQDLLSRYTEQSKVVKEIQRQIAEAKAVLDKEEPTRTQVTRGVNEAHKQVQMALLTERTNLSSLEAKVKELRSQLISAREDLKALNDGEIELTQAQREVDLQEANYRKYYEKLEQARIDQAMETEKISNISVVQRPTYPMKAVRPKTMLNLALGLFFGILGGVGLLFFSEYMDHTFKKPEDIEEKLKLSTLAEIPDS